MTSPESPAVQDTDRLREVAAEALCISVIGYRTTPALETVKHADAVLAAVLPVHRAQVLEEAAKALEATKPSVKRFWDTNDANRVYVTNDLAKLLRRLAVSAPPTPPGSPPADERATAVETGRAADDSVRELAVAPNVWVSFHGLDFAVAWEPVPGDSYRKVVKVIPHWKAPAGAVPGTGDDRSWSVTGWRCGCCERRWEITRKGSWYSSYAEQLDEFVDAWCSSLDELRAKHPDLTPLNVDNVPALLLDHRRQALAVQAGRIALREVNNLREQVEAERDGANQRYRQWMRVARGAQIDRDNWHDGWKEQRQVLASLTETIRKVRELHSPEPGWEREWKDPIEALRKGWPPCAGCATVATFTPIGKCRTLAALGDIPSPTAPERKPWPPSGYCCLVRGNDCPGHPSKWMTCPAEPEGTPDADT